MHCDRSASHYLRIALDEVFGANNFESEIVWSYKRWSNSKKGLLNCHQVIYFYSKNKSFKFNPTYVDYSPTTNIDQIFQERVRDSNGKSTYKKDKTGSCVLMKEKKGVPMSDVWEIPYLNPKAKERVGYPTQKPILLLERIIKLVTNEGDIVIDPFCGSGTTLVAAKLLNRKYIGIDTLREAIELTKNRLAKPIKSESNLLKKGKHTYINKQGKILEILNIIKAVPVQRNRGIDGFLKLRESVKPIPVKIQKDNETLEEAKEFLVNASKRNGYEIKILIKTNNKIERNLNLFGRQPYPEERCLIVEDIKSTINNDLVGDLRQRIIETLESHKAL